MVVEHYNKFDKPLDFKNLVCYDEENLKVWR